jgi:maltose-binding protein MalE
VERIANAWASSRGVSVVVVEKGFGDIRDGLKTVQPESAPDVVIGAHDWVGQLAADGSVVTINPKKAVLKQFPKYTLDAFSYGGKLYGAPVAVENIGLVVNTGLAHAPKNWADLEKQALAFKANKTFLKNAGLIDKWNREGLINSKVNYDVAKNAFLKGNAAFWLTGPWEADTLRSSGLSFRVVQVPKIKFRSVPFLGVQGMMVTKYATDHNVESLAKDFVSNYMMSSKAQLELANANGRQPANTAAAKKYSDPILSQFGKAGVGGVPMPNIPQMGSVWAELGGAWVKATQGAGATKARIAFTTAARNIANKIG